MVDISVDYTAASGSVLMVGSLNLLIDFPVQNDHKFKEIMPVWIPQIEVFQGGSGINFVIKMLFRREHQDIEESVFADAPAVFQSELKWGMHFYIG